MKYICLGYFDEKKWEAMSKNEQTAYMDECFAYDDKLRKKGHWVAAGEALQSARNAVTLRWKNGEVSVTDGPYAETKEQLAEQRIRARIRRTCSLHHRTAELVDTLEDLVVQLIKDYCAAPQSERDAVYERGEERLLRTVRSVSP